MIQASGQDTSGMSPRGSVLGMVIWKDNPGQTKDWRYHISLLSWEHRGVPPGGVGGSSWGEECLDLPSQTVSPSTWARISGRNSKNKTKHKAQ